MNKKFVIKRKQAARGFMNILEGIIQHGLLKKAISLENCTLKQQLICSKVVYFYDTMSLGSVANPDYFYVEPDFQIRDFGNP